MAWASQSERRSQLPPDWNKLVAQVWKRDGGQCKFRLPSGSRCPRRGSDVDHRVPGDDHSLSNLRLLCEHHHQKKTAQEGVWGRRRKRPSTKRAPEAHPGVVRR